ncbi:MAG: hypothetical protein C0518_09920 [Opitutus sp.]|nr:hypothetical protein [Opitutus sp.]
MLRILLGALLAGALVVTTHSAPVPAGGLFAPPTLAGVKVSANGEWLSLVTPIADEQQLLLFNLKTRESRSLGRLGFSRLVNLWWKDSDHILLLLENPNWSREFRAVEVATATLQNLGPANWRDSRLLSLLPGVRDEVLIASDHNGLVRRLNLRTGKATRAEKPTDTETTWHVNARGDAVSATVISFEKSYLLSRATPHAPWIRVEIGSKREPRFSVLGVHPDECRLLALDRSQSPSPVVALDPVTLATEVVWAPGLADPTDPDTWGEWNGTPRALCENAKTFRRHFLDPEAEAVQAQIDRALPETTNLIESASADRQQLVVFAFNDRHAGTYFHLDRTAGRMTRIGPREEIFTAEQTGRLTPFEFAARDGLTIHGHLLVPPAPAQPPYPVIVMLGDQLLPWRQQYRFDYIGQALASRGYAVAWIDHRGTHGYGRDFARRRQGAISRGMPDDIVDGTGWLVERHRIDPQRAILMSFDTAGWLALHTLGRPHPFAGWINFESPMNTHVEKVGLHHPLGTYLEVWTAKDELKETGLKEAAQPFDLLQKIEVPIFHHYYDFSGARLRGEGGIADAHARKHPGRIVMTTRRLGDTAPAHRAGTIAIWEKLFAFLSEKFPPAKTPTDPAASAP